MKPHTRLRLPSPLFALLLFASLSPAMLPLQAQPDPDTALPPDSTRVLAPGVVYSHAYIPKTRLSVHTLHVDLRNPQVGLRIGKGLEHISGLEQVHGIMHRYDSTVRGLRVLAGSNANFWKAGTIHPMGPTVSDGQLLIARQYKNWSSVAFMENGSVAIDTFRMDVAMETGLGTIPVSRLNRRVDSAEVVLYTRFFGNSVPFVDTLGIREASIDSITDESEAAVDTLIMAKMDSVRSISPESGTLKLQFTYLYPPAANTRITCRVTDMDTGFVAIPENGGVLSFGKGPFPLFSSLFVGDTFSLASRLHPIVPAPVLQMTGGTPRIVRDGAVSVEWEQEGLKKTRFVEGRYGRTAIGVSCSGDTLIVMTVEPYNRRHRRRGVSLEALARLLIARGAWQGMNLDGGSSATMVVEGETRVPLSGNRGSRKISTALMVFERLGIVTGRDFPKIRKIMQLE
ncbi:MAG: phosphodiester glycosidase family protein [Bacteroidota bacterium]|nr:phosphodiester glycosidase family protein [Bacteroidota bacterium]